MVQWQVAKEPFNLKGLAIGNGLTNPAIQYGSYADFSFANGLISKNVQSTLNAVSWPGHQCFLRTQQNSFDAYNLSAVIFWCSKVSSGVQIYPICRFGINACNTLGWDFVCSIALIFCQVRHTSVVGYQSTM